MGLRVLHQTFKLFGTKLNHRLNTVKIIQKRHLETIKKQSKSLTGRLDVTGIRFLDSLNRFRRVLFADFQKFNFEFFERDHGKRTIQRDADLTESDLGLQLLILYAKNLVVDQGHLFIEF